MLMLVGCTTNDEPAPVQSERTVTFGVTLPEEAQTRAYYQTIGEGDTPGLRMMWQPGDILNLGFVGSDGTIIIRDASIIDSSISGNKASFSTSVPQFDGETFTVYAAFYNGNGGFHIAKDPESGLSTIRFSRDSSDQSSLALDNISPMVYAVQENVSTISDFSLKHVGWVMAVKLVNDSDTDMVFDAENNATQFTFGTTGDAYIYNEHGWFFDFPTETYSANGKKENRIYLDYKGNTVKAGESVTLYRYMVTDLNVPNLMCSSYFNNSWHVGDHKYTDFDLPAAKVEPGHVYHVTVTWKGDFTLYIE